LCIICKFMARYFEDQSDRDAEIQYGAAIKYRGRKTIVLLARDNMRRTEQIIKGTVSPQN